MNKSGKILITGGTGMLGKDLEREFLTDHDVISTGRENFDVSNYNKTLSFIELSNPDIIIHSAAFKDVDGCEENQDKAHEVNSQGTRNVALAARSVNAMLVYISTDYVFSGNKNEPYIEKDLPDPVNYYGKSKLGGEHHVRELLDEYFIVRTGWLFGNNGDNFVNSMLRLSAEKDELNIIDDKYSTPTYAHDVARQIRELINTDLYGTYHCTSQGGCSWYEYAIKIFEYADINIRINPIPMKDFPFRAKRPPYSVLDNAKLRKHGIDIMPDWEESLERFVKELKG